MPEIATQSRMKGTAKPRGRRRAFTIFFAVLLVIAAVGFLYWLHARQFESTDDAQMDAHLNPISARIDGTITAYMSTITRGEGRRSVVDLGSAATSKRRLTRLLHSWSQARSMVIAQEPNVSDHSSRKHDEHFVRRSGLANARAALAAAERDEESAEAKLAESQANNARAQADLARYKLLIAKEEVSQQEYDQIGHG